MLIKCPLPHTDTPLLNYPEILDLTPTGGTSVASVLSTQQNSQDDSADYNAKPRLQCKAQPAPWRFKADGIIKWNSVEISNRRSVYWCQKKKKKLDIGRMLDCKRQFYNSSRATVALPQGDKP